MQEHAGKSSTQPLEPGHLGYVAGVLDCDGSIWIGSSRSNGRVTYALRLAVSNTRSGLPDWFSEYFGGTTQQVKRNNSKWRDEYRWQATGLRAADVITRCLPYLVIKRGQALLALEFASTILVGCRVLPASYQEQRKSLYDQMKELNKRGPA